jgi:capsular exopolysaccharide synthesis family protein
MSRIQSILEKAERDGAVRRVQTIDLAGTPARGFEAPLPTPPRHEESVHPASETRPARSIRSTGLDRNLVAVLSPGAPAAEQYRALRTRVAQADHGRPLNVILVTSPGRREGKSLTAANLALTMAQNFQSRICIVDADLRHSSLHTLFGVEESLGLADVLVGEAVLADALVGLDDQQIAMLPAGARPLHPAELLGSTAMRRTIDTLRTQFDRVIIDAPAASPLADVGILAPLVDGVVLVVQAGVTTKPAIQDAVTTIGADKFLGVVLNDMVVAGS